MMRTEKYSESQRAVSAKLTITEMRVSIKDEGFHASLSARLGLVAALET